MKAWSYFAKGAVVGPADEDQLLFAAERGEIDLDTLVYTGEFGPDTPENWKQLGFTELADKVSKVMDISDTLARDVADVASTTLSHNTANVASSTLSRDVLDIAWEPQQDKDNHQALIEPPPPTPQRYNDNQETGKGYFAENPNPLMREIQTKRWLRGIGIGMILLFFLVIGIGSHSGSGPSGLDSTNSTYAQGQIKYNFIMCRNVETLNRLSTVQHSGDNEVAALLLQRQMMSGECTFSPPIGTRVRVEQRSLGRICITQFGSMESCKWTFSNIIE